MKNYYYLNKIEEPFNIDLGSDTLFYQDLIQEFL